MDTRTGEIINLSKIEADIAQAQYDAWLAGLLGEEPRYRPIKDDFIGPKPQIKKYKGKVRSYKDFCR
jgi:hypothetical protein